MAHRHRILAVAAGLTAAVFGGAALAHDFWVQPLSFWIAPNTTVMTSLQVGHGKDRQRWDSDASRVLQFRDIGPGGVTDHQAELRRGSMAEDHPVTFGAAGTHVLLLETNHAESTLPSVRFNDYLKQEGLTPALDLRARTRSEDKDGRETYSRRAKALVQVGPGSDQPQPWVMKPVGFNLEIVPLSNPYAPGAKGELAVVVLCDGKPLAGATVMLNNLQFDGRPIATVLTDASGRAAFTFPRSGSWQVNVLWTKPLKGNPKADLDTTFSSLTFGFPPGAASR